MLGFSSSGSRLHVLLTVALGLSAVLQSPPASAQISDNLELHGFVLGNFAGRTGTLPANSSQGDFLLGEERVRLDLTAWADTVDASADVRVDFIHDALSGDFDVDVREAYVDYIAGDFDFRIGRQIATWGVGDLLFINDVFPKDWVSFFSGRPLEYLKIGVDGFRTRYSSDVLNFDLLVLPSFTPDNLPGGERFVLTDPFVSVPVRTEERPRPTYGNTEVALRLYRRAGNFDVSVYVYRGFWRTPAFALDDPMAPNVVTTIFPRVAVYGASAQTNFLGGVLSLEGGYYDSREADLSGTMGIPELQKRFLAGYQKEIRRDFTLGAQYYGEGIPADASTGGDTYRDTVTLRLERFLRNRTWKLGLFTFLSPADSDYLIQPEIAYKFSDEFGVTVGGNLFGGAETTFLGRFDGNDNLYVSLRLDF